MTNILIVYYSVHGSTLEMAEHIASGVQSIEGASFTLRTVPKVSAVSEKTAPSIAAEGAPYVQASDLRSCDGIILGSPTRFGNMAASMKYFIDSLTQEWLNGTLVGKPAGVFTSASSLHGGHESTLLTMMLPLLHHGALLAGLPYTNPELKKTRSGGTPYGPSHWSGRENQASLSDDEQILCFALGARIASLAMKLGKA